MIDKLQALLARYHEISAFLESDQALVDMEKFTTLSKEHANLEPIKQAVEEYFQTLQHLESSKTLLEDKEFEELAKEEIKTLKEAKLKHEEQITQLLIPKDTNDSKNILLELRAGTGGDEAALFVSDLFQAYLRYAENQGWKVEIINQSEGTMGGFKEIIALIKGEGAYSRMKFERGVHRVQRVPLTESQGRIHTSAITVAVIPEAGATEITINPSDLKIDVMRSSGHGGQSVNTTDSAVRITHLPSGLVVTNQDGKSQHKNKEMAMKVLRSRLLAQEEEKRLSSESQMRKMQVGSGDRSDRIRTYNYPQNRISDHRINLTLYRLVAILQGGLFDEVIEPIIAHTQAEKMKTLHA